MKNTITWLFLLLLLTSCEHQIQKAEAQTTNVSTNLSNTSADGVFFNTSNTLDKYWYQGKAELNVYELSQNRYQGIHPGKVLFIFVSEDFLADKQVKNDTYKNKTSTPILKLNAIQKFTTGFYDYSMMTSVFTPVKTGEHSRTMKVTNSSQDWCGQSLSQVNLQAEKYSFRLLSYFENEGDQNKEITTDLLEDELWTRIRMLGENIPTGQFLVVPSMNFLRLRHQPYQAYPATISIQDYTGDVFTGDKLKHFTISYPDFQRSLSIVFEQESPHKIIGWEDTYPSSFDGKARTSTARLQNTVLEKYWSMNANTETNAKAREQLGW